MPDNTTYRINAAIFGLFFVLFLHAIEDPDIWFHMTIGRAVLDQGTIPTEEFYVFTRLGDASEFHEWGFGLIYHVVYEIAGINGMIIFNALIGALTVFILYLAVRLRGISIAVALGAAAVGFWLMEFRFVQRPENFLYLAIATTLYILERYRQQSNWHYLLAVPLVGLLLSQIHPSVIMLGLVMGTYLAEAVLRKKPDLIQAGQLGATITLTLLLSLINPYGLEQLVLPIKFSLQSEFLQSFVEFLPALSTGYAYRFIIALLIIALLTIAFSLGRLRKRFSLAEWLILIAFTWLTYQHVRDIALLGIALVLPFATAIAGIVKPVKYQHIIAVFLVIFAAVDSARSHYLTFDINRLLVPVSGAEVVAKYSRSSNILNFYHFGNYLAWRLYDTHKVIIDGRNFQDNKSIALHDSLLSAGFGWQNALDRYDIDTVVTPATLPYSGNFIPLAFRLVRTPQWVMINREPAGLVFIRRDRVPDNVKVLPERELWLQARAELKINLRHFPASESSRKTLEIVNDYLER